MEKVLENNQLRHPILFDTHAKRERLALDLEVDPQVPRGSSGIQRAALRNDVEIRPVGCRVPVGREADPCYRQHRPTRIGYDHPHRPGEVYRPRVGYVEEYELAEVDPVGQGVGPGYAGLSGDIVPGRGGKGERPPG